MSDFFPDPPQLPDDLEDEPPQPAWLGPPEDVLPGVVPVELILGRSEQAVVMLAGMRAFPTGVGMTLLVRTRGVRDLDLHAEVFDDHYRRRDADSRRERLAWGFELADGRRATSVDHCSEVGADGHDDPRAPVLSGGGGGGGVRAVDRDYWPWPLPPTGPLTVVCQWPRLGITPTTTRIDADVIVAAAGRAEPVWAS